ncbi:MAG TPA: hypothetical protein VMU82_13970, partial [Acetobacteraceae bacterium]|nr:hypothetical protein [Acetobacteraceae bacterium]
QLARSGELALLPMAPLAPAFVPVEIVPEGSAVCAGENGDGVMVIELPGDRRIHVDRHVDTDALRRVLTALGAAP